MIGSRLAPIAAGEGAISLSDPTAALVSAPNPELTGVEYGCVRQADALRSWNAMGAIPRVGFRRGLLWY